MNYKKSIILILLLLIVVTAMSFLQDDSALRNIQRIRTALSAYMKKSLPQKIYLHIDKTRYFVGERIWFKAYLMSGITHRMDSLSDPVYVELVNPFQITVQIIRLRIINGEGKGSFLLRDTVPEGIYQIRAYTNWMKNWGPAYYFNRNLEIRNPKKEYLITTKEAKSNKKKVKKLEKHVELYRFGLFPEGGNLLIGVQSKIAFKAVDGYGRGVYAEGVILDETKKEICSFHTEYNGMGYFLLKPQKKKKYYAQVKFPDQSIRKIPLPEAIENAVSMTLTESDKLIRLKILSNKEPSNDRPANDFIVIGQTRGKIYFSSYLNILDQDSTLVADPDEFPSGITQFTLFNNRLLPIAERMYFINHRDFINFTIDGRKSGDSIQFNIKPENESRTDRFFSGSVSVLLADSAISSITQENILTELLLCSDLPGIIQNPSYYLQQTAESRKNADLLMLTNGWKRFAWENVIQQHYSEFVYEKEQGITVEGQITREIFEFPVKDANVSLFVLNKYNDEYKTISGRNGRFFFNNLDYDDTIDVRIVARKPGGGKNVVIHLPEEANSEIKEYSGAFFLTTTSKIDKKAYRRHEADLAKQAMEIRQKELDSIFSESIYGTPDYVLWGNEIPSGSTSILDAMKGRIPGVNVVGNSVTIRGINTIMGSTDPLLLVDGIPTSFETINSIPVNDVDRIEVLKGPSAAMYGSRGANGVIAIYTKHGTFMKKGEISFSMLGYHVVEQFYSPTEENIENRITANQLPITIFWGPDIKIPANGSVTISFPFRTKLQKEFQVIFEGINDEGTPGYCFTSFE
jgi:TonB-dependent SusC/RagA subfamily outer membrane receptor